MQTIMAARCGAPKCWWTANLPMKGLYRGDGGTLVMDILIIIRGKLKMVFHMGMVECMK